MDLDKLAGAADVIGWFGYMPTFHDAEVIEIILRRNGDSLVSILFWHTNNELDELGSFQQDKHAVVTFRLTEVSNLRLGEFNHQNAIIGVEIEPVDGGFRLELLHSFGVSGTIDAQQISVELKQSSR